MFCVEVNGSTKQGSGKTRGETEMPRLLFKKHANLVESDRYMQCKSATKRHRPHPNLRATILAQ
ncbi:hypothetical protein Bdiaspc4_23375 [Bradyrhizobium diazoefficiens]|uniref:Uncharacterized protein n=1 Tax=Bradyrhizobium diazoefficiens TaxID=1355477 RepID=A0A0E4FY12_9BRAD|nr:hypothetical protein AAV28_19590 [Bradyrhizobium diazoefficiens USDA 110]APO53393.1 hypothetical protein BD122_23995 [Bradyrhizobium diazoefficiens]MDA9396219.1 hypothetical protein [Bradyrhizobium sp. CCBAU 45394]MDA9538039.1 hypothetical protein [Bradyrhizobium sp. CCBAU 21362]KOY09419.1 hypothetical protein AF336_15750 [Bradyrhizobium diazoefficiens]